MKKKIWQDCGRSILFFSGLYLIFSGIIGFYHLAQIGGAGPAGSWFVLGQALAGFACIFGTKL